MRLGWYTNILLEADNEEEKKKKDETTEEGEDYQLDERPETEEELVSKQSDDGDITDSTTDDEGTEDEEGEDYQLDDETTEEDSEGDMTDDEDGDDYQLDSEGGDEEGEVTGDSGEDVDGENSEDDMEDDESGDLDDSKKEKYKKMILLDDYKELYNISISLQKSCENLNDRTNIKNKRMYNYLDTKINQLVDKISFTIRIMFINEEYKKLLTLFYHYKIQINDIVKLFEFLIQSEEE